MRTARILLLRIRIWYRRPGVSCKSQLTEWTRGFLLTQVSRTALDWWPRLIATGWTTCPLSAFLFVVFFFSHCMRTKRTASGNWYPQCQLRMVNACNGNACGILRCFFPIQFLWIHPVTCNCKGRWATHIPQYETRLIPIEWVITDNYLWGSGKNKINETSTKRLYCNENEQRVWQQKLRSRCKTSVRE